MFHNVSNGCFCSHCNSFHAPVVPFYCQIISPKPNSTYLNDTVLSMITSSGSPCSQNTSSIFITMSFPPSVINSFHIANLLSPQSTTDKDLPLSKCGISIACLVHNFRPWSHLFRFGRNCSMRKLEKMKLKKVFHFIIFQLPHRIIFPLIAFFDLINRLVN